jgi:hypothetical protein
VRGNPVFVPRRHDSEIGYDPSIHRSVVEQSPEFSRETREAKPATRFNWAST